MATTGFFMPAVDDPRDFGRIAATNPISDVHAMGGTPIFTLALVGMPVNVLPIETIAAIRQGGESICAEAGVPVASGRTIDSVEPMYGLVVLGLVHPSRMKRNADSRAGDKLILGKPIGVGVLSAALKKNELRAAGYAQMIDSTTRLNTPGMALGKLDGVHALTDVTGFGLAGHTLELARGAKLRAHIDRARVPMLAGVRELAAQGRMTGASGCNWAANSAQVTLPAGFTDIGIALLNDPQTSGGLLVSCGAGAVDEVLSIFRQQGFTQAAVIGEVSEEPVGLTLR